MTVHNLEYMFRPKSVAVAWSENGCARYGETVLNNIVEGGFGGEIFSVHPQKRTVKEIPAFENPGALPSAPDLVVVAGPRENIPTCLDEFGSKGAKAATLMPYGFSPPWGIENQTYRKRLLETAGKYGLRMVGCGSLGIMAPYAKLDAGYARSAPLPGNLAFVAQSGTLVSSVLDWATGKNVGFSHLVSLGDIIDVDFGDMLDYLAMDGRTRAILLYMEQVCKARKFMSAARAAARLKPVIVVKGGRLPEGAKAAESHTGAMAGSDAVYDAVFRRSGILRVNDLDALFDAVQTLSLASTVGGNRLAVVTNGGAIGVLAVDALAAKKGRLAELSEETVQKIDALLPCPWPRHNPVDIGADADAQRYAKTLEILLDEKNADAVLVVNCPNGLVSSEDCARAVAETTKSNIQRARTRPVLTSWLGNGEPAEEARKIFAESAMPSYETPEEAVRGFMQLARYKKSREALMQVPPNIPEHFTPDTQAALDIVKKALEEGRTWLDEAESKNVLSAYQIPVAETHVAQTPEQAMALAEKMGGPVVLKILSSDILYKTEASGVVLNIEDPATVEKTASAMLRSVRAAVPHARISGFTVQPMVKRPHARQLIFGATVDKFFGPVVIFGHGGMEADLIEDSSMALPPLNMDLAKEVVLRTRVSRLLEPYRNVPAADREAVELTLVKVSQLVCDLPQVTEMEINPFLADENGVIALDARIKVEPTDKPAESRLAIRPYPKQLEETIRLADGANLLLRPVRPEDGPEFQEMFAKLSPEDIRFRFLHPMKSIPPELSARLTQIDYDRDMALVLVPVDGRREILGVVRISASPDMKKAEFAIVLRRDMTGQGLGSLLLKRIVDYSRDKGIGTIYGEVLSDNRSMLRLAEALGFERRPIKDEPGVMHVFLEF